jgi:hypothetical protein
MAKDKPAQPTQATPKGAQIPIPKRKDVERDLRKLIAPDRSVREDDHAQE